MSEKNHILDQLYDILQQRKNAQGDKSYVASLYQKGSPKIAEKILEEAQEFIDEAFHIHNERDNKDVQKNLRNEGADLIFHILVMLSHHNVPPSDIFDILEGRFGISGHEEKASRTS